MMTKLIGSRLMKPALITLLATLILFASQSASPLSAATNACTVDHVIDGNTFACADGRNVRMLQMVSPTGNECGAEWAKAALQYIFLPPGRTVDLEHDRTTTDAFGHQLAFPIWRGSDGQTYNLSIVLVYVGLAKAATVGTNNTKLLDWANASQVWASTAQWNMWAPGSPFTGGGNCGGAPPPPPPAAPPPPPPPPAPAPGFGEGTFIVGQDIAPGTYRAAQPSSFCYWARLSGFGGSIGDINANDITTGGPSMVTIKSTDSGFESSGCGFWTSDLSPITSSPDAPFGPGTYIVGVDIAAGTWRADGTDSCYWQRVSGFTGDFGELIANDFTSSPHAIVTISASDRGFTSSRCGTWTKIT